MAVRFSLHSFDAKKMNRVVLLMALLAVSCGISEIGGGEDRTDPVWKKPYPDSGDSGPAVRERCYVTAVDYQDGYDWLVDRDRGEVKCSLVVFADGRPVMKVAVSDHNEVSSDPDMHRLAEGHLYTDFATGDETVVKRDGEALFRYAGREHLVGFVVCDGDVYTLGSRREGPGFSCRRNGELVFERDSGYPFRHLQIVDGKPCFAYCEQVRSGDGSLERYWWYDGVQAMQIAVREDVSKVWDIIWHEGKVCWAGSLVGIGPAVLSKGDTMSVMDMPSGAQMLSCSLMSSGDGLYVEGLYSTKTGASCCCIWKETDSVVHMDSGWSVTAVTFIDDGACCVMNPSSPGQCGRVFRCDEMMDMPEGYVCMGNGAVAAVNGILHVGLSSKKGDRPVLWRDGLSDTLDVNGFITSVSR